MYQKCKNWDIIYIVYPKIEKSLSTLAALHSHKNLAFIGPAGTGKTHLAMAFAYECCCKMLKAYFIKMTELNELFVMPNRNLD